MPAGNKYNQFATLWSSRMLTSSTNLIYLWIVDLWRICQVDPSQPILEKEIRKYVFNTYIQYNPKCINFFCTKIERQSLVDFSKEFLLHQRYFLSLSYGGPSYYYISLATECTKEPKKIIFLQEQILIIPSVMMYCSVSTRINTYFQRQVQRKICIQRHNRPIYVL